MAIFFFSANIFILLYMTSFCQTLLFDKALKYLSKTEDVLKPTDFITSTVSNLLSVHSATNKLREEDNAENRKSYQQALTGLTVLNVGGSALAPYIEGVVTAIADEHQFAETRKAWEAYHDIFSNYMVQNWDDLPKSQLATKLLEQKLKIVEQFSTDAKKVSTASKGYQALIKAKNWFNVKSVAKVLGPLFDVVSIGVNAWNLDSAVKSCVAMEDKRQCSYGTMFGATLGICSGLVGVATFAAVMMGATAFGPVGAVIGLTLGIAGTLIERFWPKPPDYDAIETAAMQKLQQFSRYQLYAANQYLHVKGTTKNDIYVVNQGHLTKIKKNEGDSKLMFKVENRKEITLPGRCEVPVIGDPASGNINSHHQNICPYLVEGDEWGKPKQYFGYDFYGFTPETSSTQKKKYIEVTDEGYKGTTLLINTDSITKEKLEEDELNTDLRGLDIDTNNNGQSHNDLISLSNMKNIEKGKLIKIKMGKGNDALNIDGMLGDASNGVSNVLYADLGESGHNSLSFMGLQLEKNGIDGIIFNNHNNKLEYKLRGNNIHHVGTVKNVELLVASSGNDKITLFAHKNGQRYAGNPKEIDFTVYKFAGKGVYEVDVGKIRVDYDSKRYKIIDSTTNGANDNKCNGHVPELRIIGLPLDAVPNDILYKGNTILIYANLNSRGRNTGGMRGRGRGAGKDFCKNRYEEENQEGGTNGKKLVASIFLSTRCPVKIHAQMNNKECVLDRPLGEIDLTFYGGRKIVSDFSKSISKDSTEGKDVVILKCPTSKIRAQINLDLRSGDDTIVLRQDVFIDPCRIDGEGITLLLKKLGGDKWELNIKGGQMGMFGAEKHTFSGASKIINEYGTVIYDLRNGGDEEVDLFKLYTSKTAQDMIGEKDSEEVKKEMKQCMKDQSEIRDDDNLATLCWLP